MATTLSLEPSAPSRPYASLRAAIGVTIILQNFRKCLKARLRRRRGAGKPFPTGQGATWKTSQLPDAWKPRRSPRVRLTWPAFSSSESRDLWFRSLIDELDKYTGVGRTPLWNTAADEKIFLHHDSPFCAKSVSICEVAYYISIVTAVLGRLSHCRQQAGAQPLFAFGEKDAVDEGDDLDDEKFVANLEHLLRCLERSLYDLLVQKTVELLDLEALYWQQHLNDELFAEKPGRRQPLSSTWPWTIRTALLVLWGVCWMFYDSFRDSFWEYLLDPDSLGGTQPGTQAVSVNPNLTPNPVGSLVVPPALSWQAPNTQGYEYEYNIDLNLSEPLIINAAPQPIRQQGYENEHEIGEPHLSILNSKGGQRADGDSFSYELYNHGRVPQGSLGSGFGTAAVSIWPNISGSPVSDLSTDAWPSYYNQPSISPLPVLAEAPLLTLQAPDAERPTRVPEIYSSHLPREVRLNNFQAPKEEEYDPSMPDSDNYPSPASEGSGGRLAFKDTSPARSSVIMSINKPDQTSPSSVESTERRKLSLKRDQEPPRNEVGQITCIHQECGHSKPPTFQRKCEWSKHMDKHDRPYICTEIGCEKIRGFTYSGGLLRHQREVHKKHGGPKAPLMCPHQDCKRSTGKGFTRKENLVEHLRRVHRKDASDHDSVHDHRTSINQHDDDDEPDSPPAVSRKRKRSLDDTDAQPDLYAPSTVSDEGGDDLREEVKRLKRQSDEKDRRLRDLEAFVATLKQQMQR